MENNRLILLEGLPGTGKSTNSYFLSIQLARNGSPVKWFHEVARPHPVLFFSEAGLTFGEYEAFLAAHPHAAPVLNRTAVLRKGSVGIDLLALEWDHLAEIGLKTLEALQKYDVWSFPLARYTEFALEKWARFTEKALEHEDEIYLFDSSVLQYQIYTYLLKNAPYWELERFVLKLMDIVKPLNPSLLYFYRENPGDTIDFLEALRGRQFMESIWERDKANPYYRDKPAGAEGHRRFLLDYALIARQLFDTVDCRKMSIEISGQDWDTYEDGILSFFGLKRISGPDALPPEGVYRNESLGREIGIRGRVMTDPDGTERLLTPKSAGEFYVQCLPVVLHFQGENELIISGGQICERWTTSGMRFLRI